MGARLQLPQLLSSYEIYMIRNSLREHLLSIFVEGRAPKAWCASIKPVRNNMKRHLKGILGGLLLGTLVLAQNIVCANAQITRPNPAAQSPQTGEPTKPKCEIEIQFWHQYCPPCEQVRSFLPALQAQYPCVIITEATKSTPVDGGYPRALHQGQPVTGPDAIKSLIETVAKACKCADKPKTGVCFCKLWAGTNQPGYTCMPKETLGDQVTGTLPECNNVSDCAMTHEECARLTPPGKCQILDCKEGRSPRCVITEDKESEDCDGKCSTTCGAPDPLMPFPSDPLGKPGQGGEDEPKQCVPNCEDADCCSMPMCKGHQGCSQVKDPPEDESNDDGSPEIVQPDTEVQPPR
jgi:hypothetical protein